MPAVHPLRVGVIAGLVVAAVGAVWVLGTDLLLYGKVTDPAIIARLETAKGWGFVGLGALIAGLVAARAVAALYRAHSALAAVVDSIADGVLMVGKDGSVVDANAAATRILATPSEELIGMSAGDFSRRFHLSYLDGRLVPPSTYASQRALTGERTPAYKAVLYPPGRRSVTIQSIAAPVHAAPDGPVTMSVSVMRDITATEELERTRNRFFSAAAHSLKTPLATIMGHAELALMRAHSEPMRRSVTAIVRQCRRIDRLVQNLLVMSRIGDGTLRLYPAACDLAPIVAAVADEMRAAYSGHCLRLEACGRAAVFGDRERLGLAIRNLVELAGEGGTPGSEIGLALTAADGLVRVAVTYMEPGLIGPELAGRAAAAPWLKVARHVAEAIAAAHGSAIGVARTATGETVLSFELPEVTLP